MKITGPRLCVLFFLWGFFALIMANGATTHGASALFFPDDSWAEAAPIIDSDRPEESLGTHDSTMVGDAIAIPPTLLIDGPTIPAAIGEWRSVTGASATVGNGSPVAGVRADRPLPLTDQIPAMNSPETASVRPPHSDGGANLMALSGDAMTGDQGVIGFLRVAFADTTFGEIVVLSGRSDG
jgi:hypothetical protein